MKKMFFYAALLILAGLMTIVYADTVQRDAAEHMVRLHILANSDSDDDQAVKRKVRDVLTAKYGGIDTADPEQLRQVEETTNRVLSENGMAYGCRIFVGNAVFPQKQYENITLPSGEYYSLRILLGEGKGQNWWCVIDPPMCFTESAVGVLEDGRAKALEQRLNGETYQVIRCEKAEYRYKLKLVEWVKKRMG